MTRRDLVWACAYGAAFADAMRRGCHGQPYHGTAPEDAHAIDATAEATRWATVCADAAVASLGSERANDAEALRRAKARVDEAIETPSGWFGITDGQEKHVAEWLEALACEAERGSQ